MHSIRTTAHARVMPSRPVAVNGVARPGATTSLTTRAPPAIKRREVDPQDLGCPRLVPPRLREHPLRIHLAQPMQRPRGAIDRRPRESDRRGGRRYEREMLGSEGLLGRQNDRALDG